MKLLLAALAGFVAGYLARQAWGDLRYRQPRYVLFGQ